jgi:hypothetical protein
MTQDLVPSPFEVERPGGVAAMPFFKYVAPKLFSGDHGSIFVGDTLFHRIGDPNEFYAALGCQPNGEKAGWAPSELFWHRYTRDGATKSQQCLQSQIAAYLHKQSDNFRTRYGQVYANLVGNCKTNCVKNVDEHCLKCPMHPQTAG